MSSSKNVKVEKPSNSKIIRSAIIVILVFSLLTIALILNLRGRVAKVLDVGVKHSLKVVRIIDLKYPRFSEKSFILFLKGLEKEIKDKLGYTVEFKFVKSVLADNWLSADLDVFSTQAAKDWFKVQDAVTNSFSWLQSHLKSKNNREILSSYYTSSNNLLQLIKRDFTAKTQMLFKLLPKLKGDKIKFSGAYWSYFLENFVSADFVVSNSPIFLPYKDIPVDAVTRGGLILNLLTKSKNKAGRSYLLSLYSILAKLSGGDAGQNVAIKVGLQGFASYLTGMPLLSDSRSSMYPLMGYDFSKWLGRKQRAFSVDLASLKKLSSKSKR